jgi:hypothetical protein
MRLPAYYIVADAGQSMLNKIPEGSARVAAVGDGSQVVAALHAFLAEADNRAAPARIGGP